MKRQHSFSLTLAVYERLSALSKKSRVPMSKLVELAVDAIEEGRILVVDEKGAHLVRPAEPRAPRDFFDGPT